MPRTKKLSRNLGACTECIRNKRKCEQRTPNCLQCRKRHVVCELGTFKGWKKHDLAGEEPASSRQAVTSHPADRVVPDCNTSERSSCCPPHHGDEERQGLKPPEVGPQRTSAAATIAADTTPVLVEESLLGAPHQLQGTPEWGAGGATDIQERELSTLSRHSLVPLDTAYDICTGSIGYATPTILAPSPLPMDLIQNPQHRFFWSYFQTRAIKIFSCLDPAGVGVPGGCTYDPYSVAISSMVVSSLPVRLAALGFSAFLYQLESPMSGPPSLAAEFGQQAARVLVRSQAKRLPDVQSLLETMVTVLFLTLFDTQDLQVMLDLAKSSATCLLDPSISASIDNSFSVFLHILRWQEICTQCSLRRPLRPERIQSSYAIDFQPRELEATPELFRSWVVHPLYTFSYRWINPLLRLGRLARARLVCQSSAVSDSLENDDFEDQVGRLEEELLNARHMDLIEWQCGSQDDANMRRLNEAMYPAIFVLFYTRLRDWPWTAPLIRQHVRKVCEQIAAIEPNSRTLNNAVFPLFAAGCDAVDVDVRTQLIQCIDRIHWTGYWFNQKAKLGSALHHVWEVRDQMPGASWVEWSQHVLPSKVDCIPV